MPVLAAVERSFVAVAPGSVNGYVTVPDQVAGVQVTPVSHVGTAGDAAVKSAFAMVLEPLVKVVFESVTFQPDPDPVLSPMSRA